MTIQFFYRLHLLVVFPDNHWRTHFSSFLAILPLFCSSVLSRCSSSSSALRTETSKGQMPSRLGAGLRVGRCRDRHRWHCWCHGDSCRGTCGVASCQEQSSNLSPARHPVGGRCRQSGRDPAPADVLLRLLRLLRDPQPAFRGTWGTAGRGRRVNSPKRAATLRCSSVFFTFYVH